MAMRQPPGGGNPPPRRYQPYPAARLRHINAIQRRRDPSYQALTQLDRMLGYVRTRSTAASIALATAQLAVRYWRGN